MTDLRPEDRSLAAASYARTDAQVGIVNVFPALGAALRAIKEDHWGRTIRDKMRTELEMSSLARSLEFCRDVLDRTEMPSLEEQAQKQRGRS